MAFIKAHGLKLAGGNAVIENAVLERLSNDLDAAGIAASNIGRIYYNSATDLFMGVFDDGAGGKELRAFATGATVAELKTELLSTAEGEGSDLIGFDGHTGSQGFFTVNAGGLGDSVDSIVEEIDGIEQTLSTLGDTYVDVAGDSMTGSLSMGTNKITNVAEPTADGDAATKAYVDSMSMGLEAKSPVRAIALSNVDLAGTSAKTIDGVSLTEGDRVLVSGQTTGTENGIYVVNADNSMTRSVDFDEPSEVVANVFCFVEEGTAYADTGWVLTNNNPITLGADALVFVQFSAPGQYAGGEALSKSGLVFDVLYDGSTIVLDGSNQLKVADDYLDGIQAELNATQTGAGLDSNGNYVANAGSNYLTGATSLQNADNLLDTQIKTVADDLAALGSGSLTDLQNEVDAIEAAMGSAIDTDGNYVAFTTTNYINGNASVSADLIDLDAAIKVNADALAAEISATNTDFTNLQAELDQSQTSIGLAADGTLSWVLSSPALSGVTTIKSAIEAIDAEITADNSAVADLQTEVDAIETASGGIFDTDGTFDVTSIDVTNWDSDYSVSGVPLVANASDLADVIEALGSQTSAVASYLPGLIQKDTDLQAELDATQAGAGLGTDGTYAANAGTNYLTTSTSLKDADEDLDSAIKQVADDLAALGSGSLTDLQNEVDAIETAMGTMIDTDGVYVAFTTTNFINGNASVAEDLTDLDTQVKANADNLAAEIAATNTDISDLQSELDDTQVGAGLGTDGGYLTNGSANYIDSATSLKDADDILDAQAKVNADANAATQSELDDTQVGAGLDTDGGYTADATTNYLTTATSLKDADKKLDSSIKQVADDLAALGSGSLTDLQNEVDAIETAMGAVVDTNGDYVAFTTTNFINGNASVAEDLTDLDAAIQGNVAELNNLEGALGSIVDPGLGTYVALSGTNFINGNSNITEDLTDLDAAVKQVQDDIAASVYTEISASATSHTITHSLASEFVEVQVWVLDPTSSKYENAVVGITQEDNNTLTIDLTVARQIKVIVRK